MAEEKNKLSDILTYQAHIDGSTTVSELSFSLADGAVIRWRNSGAVGAHRCLNVESEVLGFETDGAKKVVIRAYVEDQKGLSCVGTGGTGKRVRKDFVFEMISDDVARDWVGRLRECIESLGRPRRLFILVNPYGGKKSAKKIFHDDVKPLLEAAGILYTLQETNYQLHAQEIARSLDIQKYDGVVCVSGDGILVEVVNGLLQREDWHSAIKVPLGIIPAGTGNGMAKSLIDAVGDLYSVSNLTFAIIRGSRRSLDVVTVIQGNKTFFSVLMLTWGLIADIDIESERFRWMGNARLDFYSLVRVMNLRKYDGHIQFVPAPGYEAYGEPMKQDSGDYDGGKMDDGQGTVSKVGQKGYTGPITSLQDSDWRSLDGPFILVWVNNVPWSSETIKSAPEAKFSDGYLDVVVVRVCPKPALVSLLLKMDDGTHVKSPHVMYFKVKALCLKPGPRVGSPDKGGIIDSDGEVLARGKGTYRSDWQHEDLMAYGPPLQITVDQGLATLFSPR